LSGPNCLARTVPPASTKVALRRPGHAEVNGEAPTLVDDVVIARRSVPGQEGTGVVRVVLVEHANHGQLVTEVLVRPAQNRVLVDAGPHQLAQKFTRRTGRPARSAELSVSPSSAVSGHSGAGGQ
jgi:hypothetical protein